MILENLGSHQSKRNFTRRPQKRGGQKDEQMGLGQAYIGQAPVIKDKTGSHISGGGGVGEALSLD